MKKIMRSVWLVLFLSLADGVWGQRNTPASGAIDQPIVAVNQVGYETHAPKRFAAPKAKDGAVFFVQKAAGQKPLYKGKIKNNIGDFSDFRPADTQDEYVIRMNGETGVSDLFRIRQNLYQEQLWQPALDFMVDNRSVVGTHPSAFGGSPWRDGVYYAYEVPSLIWLYKADPAYMEAAPRQIDWKRDQERVLSATFVYDADNPQGEGVMEAVQRYYTELEPPKDKAPDAVKMMHWGLGFYLMKPYTKDPSADPLPKQIHSQVVEQFAHFLHAWDELRLNRWLPQSFYDQCLAFALTHWRASGSLDIDPLWDPKTYSEPVQTQTGWKLPQDLHPYKGRHVPGHSVLPNLYMHLVTKQKYPARAAEFLSAAQQQTQWIIDNIDWSIPGTTKGHRGSEFQTITNLVWFLQHLPEHAPEKLPQKIEEWAKVAVARSDNMWDFRRYDLENHWTIPEMNETGNLAGFPACALSAAWVIRDKKLRDRLTQLAYAQADNLFGRNPKLAAASHRPHQGYPLVERGWPIGYKLNTCARLELCRGGLDASPGTEMYPFNPEGTFRHMEGWVNWNASWNAGLAFLRMNKAHNRLP